MLLFFFSSRRRHTRWPRDWSSDVCSSDLPRRAFRRPMDATALLRDLATRPRDAARALARDLSPEILAAHPGGHPNSVAWLLWHAARAMDAQLAPMPGEEQV